VLFANYSRLNIYIELAVQNPFVGESLALSKVCEKLMWNSQNVIERTMSGELKISQFTQESSRRIPIMGSAFPMKITSGLPSRREN